jgi:hypothetical protein
MDRRGCWDGSNGKKRGFHEDIMGIIMRILPKNSNIQRDVDLGFQIESSGPGLFVLSQAASSRKPA